MTSSWFELRVHGVSGTPPESMLDFARVQQVAGDEFGRFFRRADERGTELPDSDGHRIEAYHWGKFTSGSWSQAMWLVIAPFGVVNTAQFTLEPPTSGPSRLFHTVAGASLRLVGLALTALFVLGAAVITVDLWSWQLVGYSADLPQRLVPAVALLGPVAVVAMCFFFGRARLVGDQDAVRGNPYELSGTGEEARSRAAEWSETGGTFWDAQPPTNLTRPGFFAGDTDVPALRWLHVSAGLALVALFGFAPGRQSGADLGQIGFGASLVVLAAVLVAVTLLGDPAESASIEYQSKLLVNAKKVLRGSVPAFSRLLAMLSALLAGTAIAYTAFESFPHGGTSHYPEIDHAAFVVMVVAVAGMFGLFLANLALAIAERKSPARAKQQRRFAPYAKGMACTLITSSGLFLAVGYVGAFALAAATFFDSDQNPVEAPEVLKRVVYAWGITALMFVVIAIVTVVHRAGRGPGLRQRVESDFTRSDGLRLPKRWVRMVASAMWAARLKNRLVGLLTLFAVVGIVLSVVAAIELRTQWSGQPTELEGWVGGLSASDAIGGPFAGFLMWLGGLTLTGLATLLVFLGRTAIMGESVRRGVNVLWDVIAFWPRSVHPLVPPAYSQRSVADIKARIGWHLGTLKAGSEHNARPADRLVLCGHSQGSLLSFTALVTMGGSDQLNRLGLITFGSQLQVMFSKAFPAFVNYRTITWLYDSLGGRWRNLYRETDHLAGPVLSWNHGSGPAGRIGAPPPPDVSDGPGGRREYGADWRLLDPPLPDLLVQECPLLRLRRHSDYWKDVAWPHAVDAVLAPKPP